MTGREIATLAAKVADEKKGGEIVIYDLQGLSDVTDYFVIVTAEVKLQARAIVNAIEQALSAQGVHKLGREGGSASAWVLLDYGQVVIHVFSPQLREYYQLEALWGDAPKVDWGAG
jgi:ribosome-associated protein